MGATRIVMTVSGVPLQPLHLPGDEPVAPAPGEFPHTRSCTPRAGCGPP